MMADLKTQWNALFPFANEVGEFVAVLRDVYAMMDKVFGQTEGGKGHVRVHDGLSRHRFCPAAPSSRSPISTIARSDSPPFTSSGDVGSCRGALASFPPLESVCGPRALPDSFRGVSLDGLCGGVGDSLRP